MSLVVADRYAGDEAWRNWFRICSVAGCDAESQEKLCAQVKGAMLAQLVRYGFSASDAADDDPVAFFDAYFQLKGSREKPKPLKSYFAYRIAADGIKMVNFVCGTLFGSGSGRIHDIVLDWIATLKGWKPHSVRGADGKRHLEWENAGPEEIADLEQTAENDPATTVEAEAFRTLSVRILETVSRKIKVEKRGVALLFYATAQDVPITDAAVLNGLGIAKSRAYAIREKAMKVLRSELKAADGGADPLFMRQFLETCEALLPASGPAKAGGAR